LLDSGSVSPKDQWYLYRGRVANAADYSHRRLRTRRRAWAVYVAANDRAQLRRVKVGGRTPSDAWIEDGLAPGERVIAYPSDSVSDGKRLKVVRGPA
jgi:hypothetical protein